MARDEHIESAGMILRIMPPVLLSFLLDWFADPDTVPLLISLTKDGYLWALFYAMALYAYVAVFTYSDRSASLRVK